MPIYDVYGNALATLYDVNGNELALVYDVHGNMIDGITFADETTITQIYRSTNNNQPQGGCMDDEGNVYACMYRAGQFIKYNVNTGVETVFTTFDYETYGHANGMTYNPNTGYFYVTGMMATGEVFVLDKFFNLVDTLYAKDENGNAFNCWNIAYDRKHQRFITLSGAGKVFFMDDDFNYIRHTTYVISEIWPSTAQDIETDGNFIYAINYDPNVITVVTMNGDLVKTITNTSFTGEPESMAYDWENDVYYIEGKKDYYVIRQAEFIESE